MRRSAVMRPGPTVVAVVVLLGAILAACGGGDSGKAVDAGNTNSSTTTSATTSASTPAGGTTDATSDGATGTACQLSGAAVTQQGTVATTSVSLLTDVRASQHDGCDRIVFQFRDPGPPGYTIGYQPGPFNKGESNEPLEVQGRVYLVVRFDKAAAVDQTSPMAAPTYTGPRAITDTGLTHVAEIVNSEDFEGILKWVVGVDSQRPFTVGTLSSPPRVFIDFS